MKKNVRFIFLIFITGFTCSCVDTIANRSIVLDSDRMSELQSMIETSFSFENNQPDSNDYEIIWQRRFVQNGVFFKEQYACVKVEKGNRERFFYLVNLDRYIVSELDDCSSGPDQLKIIDSDSFDSISKDEFVIIFMANVHEINLDQKIALGNYIDKIKKLPIKKITIYGVADSTGNYEINKILAYKRAKNVESFLKDKNHINHIEVQILATVENALQTKLARSGQRRVFFDIRLSK